MIRGIAAVRDTRLFDALTARAPPRYTSFPPPSYRYVPGAQPHPTSDPRGHSYDRPRRFPAAPLNGRRWRESPGYLYGCDLYNRGYWWEAHEAWEAIWHLAGRGSPERAALQALIQVANAHLKLHMGRLNAVMRLQASYGAHFERATALAGTSILGLDLAGFRARTDAYFDDLVTCDEPAHDPGRYPYLDMSIDARINA